MIKRILTILCLIIPFLVGAQTTSTFTPLANPDYLGPFRGMYYWNGTPWNNSAAPQIPNGTNETGAKMMYHRYNWYDIEPTTQGVFVWGNVDADFHQAITNHQKFSFGIMSICNGCSIQGGIAGLTYPVWLHNAEQAESPQDWHDAGTGLWVHNWNSPTYLARARALLMAVANHIATTSFNGVPYSSVLESVDIRLYGDYGEWHNCCYKNNGPAGTVATQATLDSIIQMHVAAFPNTPLVGLIAGFDLNNPSSTGQPAEVGYRILTGSNNWGKFGWKRDNWGDPGYDNSLQNNTGSYNPGTGVVQFAPLIMNKYKEAVIGGEPSQDVSATTVNGSVQGDLSREAQLYKLSQLGNGNYGTTMSVGSTPSNTIITVSRLLGYNVLLTTGTTTTSPTSGGAFNVTLNWQNTGLAPPYGSWNVQFELRTAAGAVVWTGTSGKILKLFLPGAAVQQSDNFTLTGVAAGTYNLFIIVRDPNNYLPPFPIAITGRLADGAYSIRTGIVVSAGGAVTANAGPNQSITSPASSVTLDGSASSGAITSYSWTRISGPNTPTITTPTAVTTTVTGLITGTYVFQLSVNGGVSTSQVTITVNPPPGTANAGADQVITLPTNSVTLDGTASSGASTYSWTRVSGPNIPSINSPTTATTLVTGLIQGTYVFQLAINGGASTDQVTITVNPAPPAVANAGPDQTIYLPTTSTTLDGSGSTGTISSYAWTRVSGPNTPTISNAAVATTAVTGLIQGTYVFQLSINGGASTDQVQVIVNPAIVYSGAFTGQTPAGTLHNDGQPIELGAKFRSTASGYISGVSFYKQAGNTGTHIGQLYSRTGTLLASATFTNETATGWQTVLFTTPVGILANTTYVAAYFSPSGNYSVTNFQLTSPIVNGGLSIIADGVDGPNGIYNYSATPIFPSTPGQGQTNYWVDFVFSANVAPTARITGPTTVNYPGTSIILDGSTSGDPDGSIAAYQWTRVSGPNTPTIVNAANPSTNITGLIPGTYVFQLQVTDNLGAIGLTTFQFTVFRGPSSFTIGSGSGTLSVINMGTYIPGDTLRITAGTYTTLTLTGLNGLLIVPLTSTPTFASAVFCNWNHMTVSRMDFVSTGAAVGIDATCGTIDSSTIKNITFDGYSTSCINASGGTVYTNGVNSTLKWNLVTIDSMSVIHCGKLIQGSTGIQPINNTDVMWKVSLTHITEVASTATINEGIGFTGVCYNCLAQDVTSTSTSYRPATGETGWIMGSGWWHIIRMYRWGAPGYLVHIYPMAEYRDQGDNWITQSGKFNSTQYGLASYQTFFTDTVAGIRTGTSAYIFNNTHGDQGNDASGVGSPIALNGNIVPGKHYYVKNNFGFAIGENNNNSGKQRIAVSLGGWTSIASDTSNNQYFATATLARVDSTTIGFANALGGFTYYMKTGISPATLFHSGVTNPLISTDYFLKAMRVPPDLGYDQFYGIIPGQEGFNGWIRHGRKNKFVNRN